MCRAARVRRALCTEQSAMTDPRLAWIARMRWLALCAGLLLLTACGGPQLPPLPPDSVILAFGDSLTDGVGADRAGSYPRVLAELTGRTVIEAGIPGETTAEGRARLPDLLSEHQPDLLILLEGGNDILRNQTAGTKSNLAAMIEMAGAQGIPVVLVAVPEKKLLSSAAPWYPELAEEYGLVYEGELVGRLMRSAEYKSDPVHFNAAGYRRLAEGLRDLLEAHGAL